MKKFTITIGLMLSLFTLQAMAVPMLCSIAAGASCLSDTGDEQFTIIDTDGNLDTITSFTFDRNAGFTNTFGFYDLMDASNTLDIFSGTSANFAAETIVWDGTGYSVINGGSAVFGSGATFGIFSENSGGNTWYSETALNADGLDHWLVFDTLGNTPGFLGVQNLTFALDDQYGGGDQDYNDLVATCIDCVPFGGGGAQQVPEPTPLALMGFGLLFMRHHIKKNQR